MAALVSNGGTPHVPSTAASEDPECTASIHDRQAGPRPESFSASQKETLPRFSEESVDNPSEQILLHMEVLSARDHKILLLYQKICEILCLATAIALFADLKAQPDDKWLRDDSLELANTITASVGLALLLPALGWSTYRFLRARKSGRHWSRRRRRLALLAYAQGIIQVINLCFWLASNADVLANTCRWFTKFTQWSRFLRSTCYNTIFFIFLVAGHNTNPYPKGGPRAIILDAPWRVHWRKLLFWFLLEVYYLGATIAVQAAPHSNYVTVQVVEGQPCNHWTYDCKADRLFLTINILNGCTTCAYFIYYLVYIYRGFRMLWAAPYEQFRLSQVLFRLQLRQVARAFLVVILSTMLFTFANPVSCGIYLLAVVGNIPTQAVLTFMTVSACVYFMPRQINTTDKEAAQPLLQQFAWTEAGLPEATAMRDARAPHQLDDAPMFCMETAIKLLWWSHLAYRWGETTVQAQGKSSAEAGAGDVPGQQGQAGSTSTASALLDAALEQVGRVPLAGAALSPMADEGERWVRGAARTAGQLRHLQTAQPCSTAQADTGSPAAMVPAQGNGKQGSSFNVCSCCMGAPAADQAGVDPDEALRALQHENDEKMALGLAMWNLQHVHTFREPSTDTKGLAAWGAKGTLVLAFRGTVSLANACTDIQAWPVGHSARQGWRKMRAHHGFLNAWRAGGFAERVLDFLQELVASGATNPQTSRWLLTGHSLGGALATLAAYDLARRFHPAHLECYTYGAPRTGNHDFAHFYNIAVPDTWNVINDQDAVPRSGKMWGLFKRPGQRAIINLAGDLVVRPNPLEVCLRQLPRHSVTQHWVLSYQKSLAAVCQGQLVPTKALAGGAAGVEALLAASPQAAAVLEQGGFRPQGADQEQVQQKKGVVPMSVEAPQGKAAFDNPV